MRYLSGVNDFVHATHFFGQIGGKTNRALEAKYFVDGRAAQVSINEKSSEAGLRRDNAEIGGNQRFALGRNRTGDGEHVILFRSRRERNGSAERAKSFGGV